MLPLDIFHKGLLTTIIITIIIIIIIIIIIVIIGYQSLVTITASMQCWLGGAVVVDYVVTIPINC